MKILIDLLPVIAFFGAFKLAKSFPEQAAALAAALFGIVGTGTVTGNATGGVDPGLDLVPVLLATVAAIAVTVVQVGTLLAVRKPIAPMLWISCVLIVIFGGLTLWLRDEWFIKLKPSLLYWIFAAVLLGGKWLAKRNLLGTLLASELELPAHAWDRLLYAWSVFFLFLGVANLVVAHGWSTDTWVDFKTFGLFGLTLAFSIGTAFYMARFLKPADAKPEPPDA